MKFKNFSSLIKNQFEFEIKRLRSDNGGEYTSIAFEDYCRESGIIHEKTVPYTPQQNGVSERKNRTIIDTFRSMLLDKRMVEKYWGEAVNYAVIIQNRFPTTLLKTKTPFEEWTGHKPNIANLRIFGSRCFALVPKERRRKLDDKAIECKFLGFPT